MASLTQNHKPLAQGFVSSGKESALRLITVYFNHSLEFVKSYKEVFQLKLIQKIENMPDPFYWFRAFTFKTKFDKLSKSETHSYLWHQFDMITESNRLFCDLSYVIMNPICWDTMKHLIQWAEKHKPIVLERILWGSDWPLVGIETSHLNKKTMEHNIYAAYANHHYPYWLQMRRDLFVRFSFLNAIQFLGIKKQAEAFKKKGHKKLFDQTPNWISNFPHEIEDNWNGDKLEMFYRLNSSLKCKP